MKIDSSVVRPFFIVPARNQEFLKEKIVELQKLKVPFLVVCGEEVNLPNVVYRQNNGKWDAINYASNFVPKTANTIVLNDVDTKIHNFEDAFKSLNKKIDIVYCKVVVSAGPQVKFYKILDPIRALCHIAASGELMFMKKEIFESVLPIPACMAEDSYILFKALELGYHAHFNQCTYVTTVRTDNSIQEEFYKNRTTLGILQALDYSDPPNFIKFFYSILPMIAPLLISAGKDGRAWSMGILKAYNDYYVAKKNPAKF